MAAYIPNTIRDATTGFVMSVNADGSINLTGGGVKNIAAGSTATLLDTSSPGIIRDPVSATPATVNSDGSLTYATS
jgi:hypothetical protein